MQFIRELKELYKLFDELKIMVLGHSTLIAPNQIFYENLLNKLINEPDSLQVIYTLNILEKVDFINFVQSKKIEGVSVDQQNCVYYNSNQVIEKTWTQKFKAIFIKDELTSKSSRIYFIYPFDKLDIELNQPIDITYFFYYDNYINDSFLSEIYKISKKVIIATLDHSNSIFYSLDDYNDFYVFQPKNILNDINDIYNNDVSITEEHYKLKAGLFINK